VTAGPSFLRLASISDAVVVARPDLDDWSGGAGVLQRTHGDLRYVRDSGIRRFGRRQIPPPLTAGWSVGGRLDCALYAGFLYDHYGHFLLESLARLWPPALGVDVPVVWIAGWTETFAPWMTDMLDMLGVVPDRRIVTSSSGALEVGELIVPDPGFEFGSFMHPWLARRLARRRTCVRGRETHVWLSRAALVPNSGLDEELEVEAEMRERGWIILRPEEHSLREQVEILAGAIHVAGVEGSAFHTLCLLHEFGGAVDLFTRQEHDNFELVASVFELDQVRHRLPGATPRERAKRRGTDTQWSGVDLAGMAAILDATCNRHGHPAPSS
jgi:capsular polysaccharide biosynthesis protein